MTIESWLQKGIQKANTDPNTGIKITKGKPGIYAFLAVIAAGFVWFWLLDRGPENLELIWEGFFYFTILSGIFIFSIWKDNNKYRQLIKEYKQTMPGGIQFSFPEYEQAAKILEDIQPGTYEELTQKYGKNITDMLILAGAIGIVDKKNKLQKLVSLSSIREDREAGWEE